MSRSLSLQQQMCLTWGWLLLLLAMLWTAGVGLLLCLGISASGILRENYDSVVAMERLNESLERIDSSFQFALSGKNNEALQKKALRQYQENWPAYLDNLEVEQRNITLPGEDKLVAQLALLTKEYRS